MCGLIGIFNIENAAGLAAKALEAIRNRGTEAYGIATESWIEVKKRPEDLVPIKSRNAVAHCLHSVVSYLPQPLKGKGILIANCEIYNWRELSARHRINAQNDADLLLQMLDKLGVAKTVPEIDGVFAFAYWRNGKVILARDIIGEKPLWYHFGDSFSFCSEKKALESLGFLACFELNPRQILTYDIGQNRISFAQRKFFSIKPESRLKPGRIEKEVCGLLINSVAKRLPDKKFGLLFSGGVDSSAIAQILKSLGMDFTCYLAVLDEPGLKTGDDLASAEYAAKKIGLRLKVRRLSLDDVQKYLKKVVPLIEDTNVTKAGVAVTFFAACEMAKADGIKVIFSGLGSEEIFAGYDRHRKSQNVNNECLSGLLKMYERDTYRDDVITMANSLELRLPFLDKRLVEYSLKIPGHLKLNEQANKIILRRAMISLGMPQEIASRKKRAAQYGSRVDSAIEKLARRNRIKTKSEYLRQFYPQKNLRLGVLFSSGKDSCFAMHTMQKQNYGISCLITMKSENKDSYMFHTPNVHMARMQAEAIGLPLVETVTYGEKEAELEDLEKALKIAQKNHAIEGVVTGALFSNYQRERIERVADSLGLKIFSPLWHMDQELEMGVLLDAGFKFIFSSVAAFGLDKSWLGREIGHKDIKRLVELNKRTGLNIAGEGGEFESLVLDGPMFRKAIQVTDSEIIVEGEHNARFIVKDAVLAEK
ncbi:MAG: ATP-binding protein [archaeon GW2011_AR3]|nr:MAG: ATP-binding protein [archaeon GW2011_AR3]MBS3109700.1 diphthine--ammonia ligase [Candidatus Woesearchaeota archaeon]